MSEGGGGGGGEEGEKVGEMGAFEGRGRMSCRVR